MNPMVLAAIIGAAGQMGSSAINKKAAEEQAPLDMFKSLNPSQAIQGLNTSFTIPGMQSVGNILGR